MFDAPETRYTRSGNVHIAYQVVGEGPQDLVVVSEWTSHIEAFWEHPVFARMFRRIASTSRLILFDKRGVGLSDPVSEEELASMEIWMDDLVAVLDACDSRQAVLAGTGHGGQMAVLFAATHPERTKSLILGNAYARLARDSDYPWGIPDHAQERAISMVEQTWGTPSSRTIDLIAPSLAHDESIRRWWGRLERLACSPGRAVDMQRAIYSYDVRHVLASVSQPTLVIHTTGNRLIRLGHGRYLAEHIPGARFLEIESDDHWWFVGDEGERAWNATMQFVGATEPGAGSDRVLATLLFTDIVTSTEQVTLLGDAAWKEVLDDLDALAERQVTRFQGRVVKGLGDGHLATFDGPGRAIRAATAISEGVRSLGLEVRCGVHTGEVDLRGADVGGVAVHIASRIMSLADPNEVLVSGSVPPLVAGSGFEFEDRGEHELKGVPGRWSVFAVGR